MGKGISGKGIESEMPDADMGDVSDSDDDPRPKKNRKDGARPCGTGPQEAPRVANPSARPRDRRTPGP